MDAKARILIVDDDRPTVMIIQSVLQKHGYEVFTAYNGITGLKKAQEVKPDLIILDIMMPLMDGYEVCRRLKANPDTAGIVVLILTVKGQIDVPHVETKRCFHTRVQEQIKGFDSGAVEFLTKPVKAKELVQRVKSVLWAGGFLV
jgi:DNA-binding response OmpR family regulator